MAAITNAIEKGFLGNYSKGRDDLNPFGKFLHDIVADATYAPTKTENNGTVTYKINESFHPYSAMMRATTLAFFVLWGGDLFNSRFLPYCMQGAVKTVGAAAVLTPLFHLYGVAINSLRELSGGKPSVVVNKSEVDCL